MDNKEKETKKGEEELPETNKEEDAELILIPGVSICFGSFENAKKALFNHCKSK